MAVTPRMPSLASAVLTASSLWGLITASIICMGISFSKQRLGPPHWRTKSGEGLAVRIDRYHRIDSSLRRHPAKSAGYLTIVIPTRAGEGKLPENCRGFPDNLDIFIISSESDVLTCAA